MRKICSNITITFLYFSFIPLLFCESTHSIFAQSKTNEVATDKTSICQECCTICRDSFYSKCSLSPMLADSFGVLNQETEMARLDNFAQLINSSPESDAYVVIYGGKTNKYGEMGARTDRIRKYLIDFKKQDPSRIIFVTGGFRESLIFELWLSPVKNSYPPLTPSILPENVKFKGKITSLSSY